MCGNNSNQDIERGTIEAYRDDLKKQSILMTLRLVEEGMIDEAQGTNG